MTADATSNLTFWMNRGRQAIGLPPNVYLPQHVVDKIREIHAELMRGVRGERKAPGEFRGTQNWVGAQGANLANARAANPHRCPDCSA